MLVVLTVWAFAPLALSLVHVLAHGGVLTGANGEDFYDQFQYLAWIRDAGTHGLASNLWVLGGTPHDYLQPMYFISGALWRVGLSLQLAYLLWKPVAVLVLFLGCVAYTCRHLQSRGAQMAALVVALFYETPVYAVGQWTAPLSVTHGFQIVRASEDADASAQLWGFDHAAIAIGLTALFLIAAEKLLDDAEPPAGRRRWVAVGAISGLLVSFLHPWQTVTLVIILAGLALFVGPRRRYLRLAIPVAGLALPIVYTEILSHADASWRVFSASLGPDGRAPLWALVAAFGPLVVFALLGIRRPKADRDWVLLLWPVAVVLTYGVAPHFSPHALSGVALPLAILAVRGWGVAAARLRVGRVVAGGLGAGAVLVVTLPAAAYHGQTAYNGFRPSYSGGVSLAQVRLTSDQAAAMNYLDHAAQPGGVMTEWPLALSIPAFTGRPTLAGHSSWDPNALSTRATVDRFFDSGLAEPHARAVRLQTLGQTGVSFVLADCGTAPQVGRDIASRVAAVRRFGCVTVYRLARTRSD